MGKITADFRLFSFIAIFTFKVINLNVNNSNFSGNRIEPLDNLKKIFPNTTIKMLSMNNCFLTENSVSFI